MTQKNSSSRAKIIGIAGGSASGKTTIAAELSRITGAPVISLDSFYSDQSTLSLSERAKQNYDEPQAFEIPLLVNALEEIRLFGKTAIPVYSFAEHTRLKESQQIEVAEFVIVEGIFVLAFSEIRPLLNLAVFVDTPEEIRFSRRLARDIEERGRTPESVKTQWGLTVDAGYKKYCLPSKKYANICVQGTSPTTKSVDQIIKLISKLES